MNSIPDLTSMLAAPQNLIVVFLISVGYLIRLLPMVKNDMIPAIIGLVSIVVTPLYVQPLKDALLFSCMYATSSLILYRCVMVHLEAAAVKWANKWLGNDDPPVTFPRILPVILAVFLLQGCATIAPNSASLPKDATQAEKDAAIALDVERALPGIQTASSLICTAVLVGALDEGDAADKAKTINLAASVFASLEGTESAEDIKANLLMVLPDKPHWRNLAGSLSGVWGGIRAMVKGNPDLGLKVLGAIAKGCRDATAGFAEKP